MRQLEKYSSYLNQKMQVIEKIAVNTEALCRFIHRREMKGLKRTVEERDVLIRKLFTINEELSENQTWKSIGELMPMIKEIVQQEQEMIECSRRTIQEALAERASIAAELRSSKAKRQVKSRYTNPWASVAQGMCFNEKG